MQGDHCCPYSRFVRGGLLVAVVAAALGLILWKLPSGTQRAEERLVAALPGDGARPPALTADTTAVLKTKDALRVTVGLANSDDRTLDGCLDVTLLDKDGKALAADSRAIVQQDIAAGYRFEFPLPGLPTDNLSLHCRFEEEEFTVPLSAVLVAKAHETTVAAGQEFHSGSLAAVRCGVHGVKSLTENIPLAGAEVEIRLQAKDKVFQLFKGKAGSDGVADAQFKMPALPPGQYTMVVATKSELGEEKLERQIKVKTDSKILLVTDKPLYQPGQVMHIRALTLKPFDLTPVAGENLVFEVEDGKGNKVFKRTLKTSDYGIASVDFQLADEVNMGHYQVRATLGATQAQKTVDVKKYVLPKFKNAVSTDKNFYLPKETIHLDLQSDYIFGKPLVGAKVEVTASTFDVQFQKFATHNGKTDANGHVKFDIKLPDYFVGQPLQKGDALVKLEIKITDTADHSETITKTYAVSEQPIRVSLIPEGGRLLPGTENRIFAAAIYPDGSPAACVVALWTGKEGKGEPLTTVRTNEAGLAEFKFTPMADQFRYAGNEQQVAEMLGAMNQPIWGPRYVYDLVAQARDAKGSTARAAVEVNGDMRGDNVLLRLDKAIYKGGDSMNVEVRATSGLPTAYIDVVRSGQTMLTKWLDIKDGKASHRLDLPASVFGTLEIHAYQTLATGEIVRDSRVVYVQPREELKIAVKADRDVYTPGQDGVIRFQVTDYAGRPTPAALGVLIVDEAVYALQEMQPGLEKVYFTLQEELMKPQAQVAFKPADTIDTLVRQPEVPLAKQQIAQALLATVKPKPPARWEVDPTFERQRKAAGQLQQVGWSLFQYAVQGREYMTYDADAKRWRFKADLLKELVQTRWLDGSVLLDPLGTPLSLESMARLDRNFTVDRLAEAQTRYRAQQLAWALINYSNVHANTLYKKDRWKFPDTVLADAAKHQGLQEMFLKDAWGKPFRLLEQDAKRNHQMGGTQFDYHELVSAGPDGVFGTVDDILPLSMNQWHDYSYWWVSDGSRLAQLLPGVRRKGFGRGEGKGARDMDRMDLLREQRLEKRAMDFARPMAAGAANMQLEKAGAFAGDDKAKKDGQGGGGQPPPAGAAPAMRIREYFPETLLWQPALITDDKGVCTMPVQFADSITTWRLTASASARTGLLGGVSAPLRVFQDFFVDLDLPVSLTQNDEVAFPVAVHNYMKTPQTVRIDLQKEAWFELLDSEGPSRTLSIQPNEVTSIKFRIKATKIGYQPLTVKAFGSKMSDAVKRAVEVVPDGSRVEQVFADRLSSKVKQQIIIPENCVPYASKLLVKVYPGVMSQVLEGAEGMIRLPGG
jgi:hypothetical protein